MLTPTLVLSIALAARASALPPGPAVAAPVASSRDTAELASVQDLIESLRDDGQRRAARAALAAIGAKAIPIVLRYWKDPSPGVRWELCNLAGEVRDPRALPGLADYVLHDDSPHVRWRSLWAISQFPDRSVAIAALRRGLAGADRSESWNAAVGLAYFDLADGLELLERGLLEDDDWRRWEAINALGRVHDRETADLVAPLLDAANLRERSEAVLTLGRIGGDAASGYLLVALEDPEPSVRARACVALAGSGDARALAAIERLLACEIETSVRAEAETARDRLLRALR